MLNLQTRERFGSLGSLSDWTYLEPLGGNQYQVARSDQFITARNRDRWRIQFDSLQTMLTLNTVGTLHVMDTPVNSLATPATQVGPNVREVLINKTTGPIEVAATNVTETPRIRLGNGNLDTIQGNVLLRTNPNLANPISIQFRDVDFTSSRSLTISKPSDGNWSIGGAPANIQIVGDHHLLSMQGGTGLTTLTGPNEYNSWVIDAADAGRLNGTISFTGVENLISRSSNDTFLFRTNGSVSGNIDGGPGTDTVRYQNGMLGSSDIIDLPNQRAPRVAGQARNLEASNTFAPLTVVKPADISLQVNASLPAVYRASFGWLWHQTFHRYRLASRSHHRSRHWRS